MPRDRAHPTLRYRQWPAPLTGLVIALFCGTAVLPLVWMLGTLLGEAVQTPRLLSETLLDSRQFVLLGRSLGIAVATALLTLVIGLPVAVLLSARDLPARRFFYFLVLLPLLIPSYVTAGAWIHLLSPGGLVNRTLAAWFGPGAALRMQSVPGCIGCLSLSFFPLVALVTATGLAQLDRSLVDAARLCTNRWGVLRHATLPQLRSHLAASVCLILIFVLGQYGVPSLLGVNTYPVEIFAQLSAFYDEAAAVALSLPVMVLVILLVLAQKQVMGTREYVGVTPRSEVSSGIVLGKARYAAVFFLLALFTVGIVLPFGSVLARAHGPRGVLSTAWIFRDAIGFTALLAAAAGVLASGIAFFLARALAFGRPRAASVLDVLCWLPLAVPGTIVALGYIRLSSLWPGLRNADSYGLYLLWAYVGMFCAFAVRVLVAAWRRMDPHLDEMAVLDCPHWYQRCWHVDMKIHAGAVVVSFFLVFVLALGELNATILLAPPGRDTLSVSIDNLLHYGASASASAFCLIEAGLVLAAAGVGVGVLAVVRRFSLRTG